MKAKDLINQAREEFSAAFLQAMKEGDEKALGNAIAEFSQQLQDAMLQEASDTEADNAILAARGNRVLTSREKKYYTALAQAMAGGSNIKQAIDNLGAEMPETIIDAVMDDIASQFPLLEEIDFRNTTAITKWFYNKQGVQQASWGVLGAEVSKELAGAIGEMSLTQMKLTAYMVISKDFLALGPAWLDRYVRSILAESNGLALEVAVADGSGAGCPIGMSRDLTKGTTSDNVTTYARKTPIKVKTLDPSTYGDILSKVARTPSDRQRPVKEVVMVVNPQDYLQKVMPATTILTPQGTYRSDVLPFPTRIIQSVGVQGGHAIVGLGKRYFCGMGSSKNGFIEYSDHVQFLEDNRVYTTHLYGNGMPLDNNAFVYLDISGLTAPVLKVEGSGAKTEAPA